jgi:hypothetical protein
MSEELNKEELTEAVAENPAKASQPQKAAKTATHAPAAFDWDAYEKGES